MLTTENMVLKPEQIVFLKKNARYMNGQQYGRLKENLKKDGKLTSHPLVLPLGDDKYEVISGNHRTKAAIECGFDEIPVIVITSPITEEEKVALQLSHNSITGQDDPNELHKLYDLLPLDLKEYSGLTDDDFKIDEIDLSGLSVGSPKYEQLILLFLPEEAESLVQVLGEISSKSPTYYAGRMSDFNKLFDGFVKGKNQLKIFNSAIAFHAIAELALKELKRMEAEQVTDDEKVDL